jgi:hypothetical protein
MVRSGTGRVQQWVALSRTAIALCVSSILEGMTSGKGKAPLLRTAAPDRSRGGRGEPRPRIVRGRPLRTAPQRKPLSHNVKIARFQSQPLLKPGESDRRCLSGSIGVVRDVACRPVVDDPIIRIVGPACGGGDVKGRR